MARKAGRPLKEWSDADWSKFEQLCGIHCTVIEIEAVMDTDHTTINRMCKAHYGFDFSHAYQKYSANGKASLRRAQLQLAMDGNATMQIFLGKQLLGQTDVQKVQAESTVDASIKIDFGAAEELAQ